MNRESEEIVPAKSMDQLVSLCKRRGFIFPGSDIYGGLQGTYDYGPLGVELKNNLKNAWWKSMVYERDDMEGLDSSILGHRHVYQYSGHESTFSDPLVDCKNCKSRWRADHVVDHTCEKCGSKDLTEPRPFNMMFKTQVGPVADDTNYAYLRPETAQGIFVNFKNVLDSTSRKVPFGIAQIGKSFRNEITPRNFIFRVREFEQMEIEFFVEPGTDETWHRDWVRERMAWWHEQGIHPDQLVSFTQPKEELSHYSKATVDLLYRFPHGLEELEGIANRSDYDLGSHSKNQKDLRVTSKVIENHHSTSKLQYLDPSAQKNYVPFVIEPSAGVDRGVLAVLNEAYTEEKLPDGSERIVLKFKPHLAPIKVAVIPLVKNKPEIVAKAKAIKHMIQGMGLGRVLYEDTGNVGKGYRRHDEIGTPICVTVDYETVGMGDNVDLSLKETVTVRDRDTLTQKRVPISELCGLVSHVLRGGSFS